jgi:hypothetical protein
MIVKFMQFIGQILITVYNNLEHTAAKLYIAVMKYKKCSQSFV